MFRFSPRFICAAPSRVCHYAKEVKVDSDVRKTMLLGIDSLANDVSVTLGPRGRNDILEQSLRPSPEQKERVTIAEAIELRNRLKYIGAKLVRELAHKTNEDPADGVTTATSLARAIAQAGFEKISAGASPTEIRRGVMLAINEVKRHLKTISRPVSTPEEIEEVTSIYVNNDKAIMKVVCDAISKVSRDGIICVGKGKGHTDELEVIEGMKLDCGFVSPYFINTANGEKVDFQNALLLLTVDRVSSMKTIMPVVDLASSNRKPLVIIADDISGEALKALVLTRLRTGLRVAAVKAPGYGDNRRAILKDIAIATGGAIFGSRESKARLENVKLSDLGKVSSVIVTKDDTLLLNGVGKRDIIVRRIDEIKEQIAEASTPLKKKNLRERLANLGSGIVFIHVGGIDEQQINEKIERIKIALHATRAAIEEGIVPGSGIALLKCIPFLDSVEGCNDMQRMGIEIVRRALRIPCLNIASQAGVDAALVMSYVENEADDYGLETVKGEFGNLVEMGMVDPTKIVRTAITDAAGVASLLMAS